tara:strand:+ start:1872 stop:2747 length:876 start_codon:yes stop_codon:yes gene_type:complete
MFSQNENVIEKDDGIYVRAGKFSGQIKNICYLIENTETKERYYKMTCNQDNTKCTILSIEDIELIKNYKPCIPVWTKHKINGYAYATLPDTKKKITLHSFVIKNMNPGDERINDKKFSIDHINRIRLDNRRTNLRWATQSVQNSNQNKRSRKKTAIKLPEGITQDMMPKYVYYCKECYNKEKQLFREFFRIEKHPKQEKIISSSKSSKLTILEKLEQIKEKLYNLENNIEVERELPPYYTIQNFRNAPHLTFDRRIDDKRYNLKMKMKENKSLEEELERFNEKLKKKYPNL